MVEMSRERSLEERAYSRDFLEYALKTGDMELAALWIVASAKRAVEEGIPPDGIDELLDMLSGED